MLSRKIFESFYDAMAVLVLFEHFLKQILLFNFFAHIPSFSPNMMHYVHIFSTYACSRRRIIVIKEPKRFEITEKFYASKTLLKMAVGGCIPQVPLLDPQLSYGID